MFFYFQMRESPAPLNIPTPTLAPDQGGPVACLSGPIGLLDPTWGPNVLHLEIANWNPEHLERRMISFVWPKLSHPSATWSPIWDPTENHVDSWTNACSLAVVSHVIFQGFDQVSTAPTRSEYYSWSIWLYCRKHLGDGHEPALGNSYKFKNPPGATNHASGRCKPPNT